jgi:hypothetical protein
MKYRYRNQLLTAKHTRHVIYALTLRTLTVLHRPPVAKPLRLSVNWLIDRNAISRGSVKEGRTNAARLRMHSESAQGMMRRTRIKPAYPLHSERGVAAKRGLVLQLGPPPLVAVAVVEHEH